MAIFVCVSCSVPDLDPYFFGPTGSGSVIICTDRNRILPSTSACLVTSSRLFLSLKIDVYEPTESNKHKHFLLFFVVAAS